MKLKTILIIIVALVIVVGGYLFLRGGAALVPTPITVSGEIDVVAKEFRFEPSGLAVKAGEPVKLTLKNNGRLPHNFTVEGLDIKTKTMGGRQQDAIEFTITSPGTYKFYCSVFGHRFLGMKGVLKVE